MTNLIQRFLNGLRVRRRLVRDISKLKVIQSLDELIQPVLSRQIFQQGSTSLDLGSGLTPKNPFGAEKVFGIDLRTCPERNVLGADLTIDPIPFADDSFLFVTAFDFIEHVPRVLYAPKHRFPFIDLLDEVWRVLQPNGLFLSHTPVYPFIEIFQDPTHVNFIAANTLRDYFCGQSPIARMYGFKGAFEMQAEAVKGSHLVSVLRKTRKE
jgi:SAM-dependent methyltransferase